MVAQDETVEAMWGKLMEGVPDVDESVQITSADINQQTADTFADRMAKRSRDALDDYWRSKQ